MRVRISYVVDVDDDIRREINEWYGRPGLADRDEIKNWYRSVGHSMDDDLSDMASRRDSEGNLGDTPFDLDNPDDVAEINEALSDMGMGVEL